MKLVRIMPSTKQENLKSINTISTNFSVKRWAFALEGRNLLGVETFYNSTYGEAMAYTYSYALRPRSVIAKVRFTLK